MTFLAKWVKYKHLFFISADYTARLRTFEAALYKFAHYITLHTWIPHNPQTGY